MCAQPSVGSVLQKSYMRFLGTIAGSFLAISYFIFFGNDTIAENTLLLMGAFFFSYIATSIKATVTAGTFGAVTIVIVLVGSNVTVMTGY